MLTQNSKTFIKNCLATIQATEPDVTEEKANNAYELICSVLEGKTSVTESKTPIQMLKANQVAKRLNVSNKFVWTLVNEGRLRAIPMGERLRRFSSEDVERCMEGFADIHKRQTPKSPGRPRKYPKETNPATDDEPQPTGMPVVEETAAETATSVVSDDEKEVC